jgi:hypothetical protein
MTSDGYAEAPQYGAVAHAPGAPVRSLSDTALVAAPYAAGGLGASAIIASKVYDKKAKDAEKLQQEWRNEHAFRHQAVSRSGLSNLTMENVKNLRKFIQAKRAGQPGVDEAVARLAEAGDYLRHNQDMARYADTAGKALAGTAAAAYVTKKGLDYHRAEAGR